MQYIINGKRKKINFSGKVGELLKKLGINDQIVIVKKREGKECKIITEIDELKNEDKIEIIRVVFGG